LVVLIALAAFWAVPGIVPFFSTLEASVQGIPCSGGIPLRVVLASVALIAVVVSLSAIVIAAIVVLAAVVPLSTGWRPVSVDVHGDWGIVHPLQGI